MIKNFTKYLDSLYRGLSKKDYEKVLETFSLVIQVRLANIRNQIEEAEAIPKQIEKPKKKQKSGGVDTYV